MKEILKKAEKIIYCDKTSKERIPIIYIRYFKGKVKYIGDPLITAPIDIQE